MTTITYFVLNVASFLSMWERDFKSDKKQTIPKHYLLVISEQLGDTRLCKKPSNPLQGEEELDLQKEAPWEKNPTPKNHV